MKNFGKKAGIAVLCAVFTFFTMGFFSCSNEIIGYSVVLWNIPEANIADGEVVVLEGMLSLYEGAKVRDISGNVEFVEAAPPAPAGKGGPGPDGAPAGGKK